MVSLPLAEGKEISLMEIMRTSSPVIIYNIKIMITPAFPAVKQ